MNDRRERRKGRSKREAREGLHTMLCFHDLGDIRRKTSGTTQMGPDVFLLRRRSLVVYAQISFGY